jgi:hypothetical protein
LITLLKSTYQQSSTHSKTNPGNSMRVDKQLPNQGGPDSPLIRITLSPTAQKYLKSSEQAGIQAKSSSSQHKIKNHDAADNGSPAPKSTPHPVNNRVQKLKNRDIPVRTYEAAHMTIAGTYAKGGASYYYEMGSGSMQYAVDGEIQFDTSRISGNPNGTVVKAEAIRKGALAPSEPSGVDLSVAAAASQIETQDQEELLAQLQKSAAETEAEITNPVDAQRKTSISAYRRVINQLQIGQVINQTA